jgi:regulator of nucleoside diphosphate kinase
MQNQHASPRKASRPPKIVIGADCVSKLEALAEAAAERNPDLGERLLSELDRARVVPAAKVPPNVVAIGRSVTYRDESTGHQKTVTPVWPGDADISCGRISVLTPIGVALIGLAVGASLYWDTRDGERRVLTVLDVAPGDTGERPGA